MQRSTVLHILSFLLVVTSGLAAYADKVAALDFISPKVAAAWPFILILASALHRIVLIVGDLLDDWQLNNSFGKILGLIVLLSLGFTGCAGNNGGTRYVESAGLNASATRDDVSGTTVGNVEVTLHFRDGRSFRDGKQIREPARE